MLQHVFPQSPRTVSCTGQTLIMNAQCIRGMEMHNLSLINKVYRISLASSQHDKEIENAKRICISGYVFYFFCKYKQVLLIDIKKVMIHAIHTARW
jgi:hypothetical protein